MFSDLGESDMQPDLKETWQRTVARIEELQLNRVVKLPSRMGLKSCRGKFLAYNTVKGFIQSK